LGSCDPISHKIAIAPIKGICSTDILVCQPTASAYFGAAAMYLFSAALIDYADRLSNGAKMPRVNWKDLAAYPVCIPPIELAIDFNDAIRPLIARYKTGRIAREAR
jgi:type I restriction enzyme S subunit